LDVATDLAAVTLSDLDTDQLVSAVAAAKKAWSDATVARMLSTMRGFTRWLTRRQLLPLDPCDSELLRVSSRAQRRPRAVEEAEVQAMVAAAQAEPSGRQQMFWPAVRVRPHVSVQVRADVSVFGELSCSRPE